jgi:hypothetical protein
MKQEQAVAYLEMQYSEPAGFLFLLREGEFSALRAEEFLRVLATLELSDASAVNKRLVSLLWYLPLFTEWQTERVVAKGCHAQEYGRFLDDVVGCLERVLGAP